MIRMLYKTVRPAVLLGGILLLTACITPVRAPRETASFEVLCTLSGHTGKTLCVENKKGHIRKYELDSSGGMKILKELKK